MEKNCECKELKKEITRLENIIFELDNQLFNHGSIYTTISCDHCSKIQLIIYGESELQEYFDEKLCSHCFIKKHKSFQNSYS